MAFTFIKQASHSKKIWKTLTSPETITKTAIVTSFEYAKQSGLPFGFILEDIRYSEKLTGLYFGSLQKTITFKTCSNTY